MLDSKYLWWLLNQGLMLFKWLLLMTLDSYKIYYAKYRIASGYDRYIFQNLFSQIGTELCIGHYCIYYLEIIFIFIILESWFNKWQWETLYSWQTAILGSSHNFSNNSEAQAYLFPLAETRAEQIIKVARNCN